MSADNEKDQSGGEDTSVSKKDESDGKWLSEEEETKADEEKDVSEKNVNTRVVDLDDVDYDETPLARRSGPGIAKRQKNMKGKVVMTESQPSKASKKMGGVGHAKGWSKVVDPAHKKRSLKMKEVTSSDSEYDVGQDIQDIVPSIKKIAAGKKVPANVHEAPIDNISFHCVANVEKWKYVYQRKLTLERELGKDAL